MADKKGLGLQLVVAGVGIAGAMLGYGLQHLLSYERERSKVFEDRQSAAYVIFLDVFNKYFLALEQEKAGNEEVAAKLKMEYLVDGQAAGRQIAIYGEKEVVKAVADWYRIHRSETLPLCDEKFESELQMWEKMRDALLPQDQKVTRSDLAIITAGDFCELEEGQ